ncbi:hypothetical protein [Paraburkholderia sp. BCC1876]|uniref:hypothetical protein n=1 Tax=Paraburkholderia sp. BCC1876 TaxID=2676303 RepID=UPI0015928C5C|nr:hypothetical protein [Paraburkholderia sp. BCC1876]
MDLKEIQALHAQYASPAHTIDLAGQIAGMPALPAPGDGVRRRRIRLGAFTRYRRHAMIALAVGVLAAGAGASAARIWQVLRNQTAPHVAASTQAAAIAAPPQSSKRPTAQATGDGTLPLNVAPPRPLSSADFDNAGASRADSLGAIDPRALARSADAARTGASSRPDPGRSLPDNAAAAASPIHAPAHRDAAATAVVAAPAAPAASTASATQPAVSAPALTQPAPVKVAGEAAPAVGQATPAAPAPPPADKAAARALRPMHRVVPRRKPAGESAGDPANPTASTPVSATKPPSAAARVSDVQLF